MRRLLRRWAPSLAVAIVAAAAATPVLAADVQHTSWQAAADDARFTLLAPPPPEGFALRRITVSGPACGGLSDAAAAALYTRADGALIWLVQTQRPCLPLEAHIMRRAPVRGQQGSVIQAPVFRCVTAADAAPCIRPPDGFPYADGRGLLFTNGASDVEVWSNLAGYRPLVALADSAVEVAPAPGLPPRYERLRATVLRVTAGDRLVVRADGVRLTIRLAGVRAPRPDQCFGPESRRFAARLVPPGTRVWLEDDPRPGRQYWVLLTRPRVVGKYGPQTVNARIVNSGAAKRAPGVWRHGGELLELRDVGLWAKDTCAGRFTRTADRT